MRSKVFLITGGNGLQGRGLINRLVQLPGCSVVVPLRTLSAPLAAGARSLPLGKLDGINDWTKGEDISTTQLLRKLSAFLGKTARLLPVPAGLMSRAAALLGRHALTNRVLGSLQVDISKTRQLLGWKPPVTLDQALAVTAQHFLDSRKS